MVLKEGPWTGLIQQHHIFHKNFTMWSSVLGTLLFIIYTDDLSNCLTVTKDIWFADDTTIFLSSQNKQYVYESVNKDLHSLNEWFQTNKWSLNASKTNYVLFNNTRVDNADNFNLTIANQSIEPKNEVKCLGLYLDSKLYWNTHIKFLRNKMNSALYAMRRSENILKQSHMMTLFILYLYCIHILIMVLHCGEPRIHNIYISWTIPTYLFNASILPKPIYEILTMNTEIHDHFTRIRKKSPHSVSQNTDCTDNFETSGSYILVQNTIRNKSKTNCKIIWILFKKTYYWDLTDIMNQFIVDTGLLFHLSCFSHRMKCLWCPSCIIIGYFKIFMYFLIYLLNSFLRGAGGSPGYVPPRQLLCNMLCKLWYNVCNILVYV